MRLAVMMPVGAGEADRHLERCIRHARSWADVLMVYGDAPDPATRRLIGQFADHAVIRPQGLYEQGEHLVRNQLYEIADDALTQGDLVACLDADEEIHAAPDTVRQTLLTLEHDPRKSFQVRFLHLWNPGGTVHRVDGLWQPSVGPRIYRHQPGARIEPLPGRWVCHPLPAHLMRCEGAPVVDVLHWSYAQPEHRAPKHARYVQLVGHNPAHVASILTAPTLEPVA